LVTLDRGQYTIEGRRVPERGFIYRTFFGGRLAVE
jgi:hypothetical protein